MSSCVGCVFAVLHVCVCVCVLYTCAVHVCCTRVHVFAACLLSVWGRGTPWQPVTTRYNEADLTVNSPFPGLAVGARARVPYAHYHPETDGLITDPETIIAHSRINYSFKEILFDGTDYVTRNINAINICLTVPNKTCMLPIHMAIVLLYYGIL